MKKLFLFLVFAALLAAPAFAQESKDKDKQKDYSEWQKKIKDELQLTDEQVAKWDAISKQCKDKIDAVKMDASLDDETKKARKTELKKEKETMFVELLSPEQQAKYKVMLEKKKKEAEAPKPTDK
jgi:Spy/CpxP family protein refolding chaperone